MDVSPPAGDWGSAPYNWTRAGCRTIRGAAAHRAGAEWMVVALVVGGGVLIRLWMIDADANRARVHGDR